jgi:two-component system, sensor histidine kinase PdtaS
MCDLIFPLKGGVIMDATKDPDTLVHGDVKRQALIIEFGEAVLNNGSLQDTFDDAAAKVAEGTEANQSRIVKYRPESDDMLICAGVGWQEGVVGSAMSAAANTPAGRSFRTGLAVCVEDLPNETQFVEDVLTRHGIVSLLNVPIRTSDGIFGCLEIDSDIRRRFPVDAEFFLRAFAHLLGLALSRTRTEAGSTAAAKTAEAATATVAQRTIMLQELQHRMRNGLQTIISAINAEVRATNDPAGRKALERVIARVARIGRVYARLDEARRGGNADLQVYLAGLCADLTPPKGIQMETELLPVNADHGTALPIGLIVNEAVTNCVKHAFPHGSGKIHVALKPVPGQRARVSILDDGVGPVDRLHNGSGTDLMNALARNIGATVVRGAGPGGGTIVVMEFPTHA